MTQLCLISVLEIALKLPCNKLFELHFKIFHRFGKQGYFNLIFPTAAFLVLYYSCCFPMLRRDREFVNGVGGHGSDQDFVSVGTTIPNGTDKQTSTF